MDVAILLWATIKATIFLKTYTLVKVYQASPFHAASCQNLHGVTGLVTSDLHTYYSLYCVRMVTNKEIKATWLHIHQNSCPRVCYGKIHKFSLKGMLHFHLIYWGEPEQDPLSGVAG